MQILQAPRASAILYGILIADQENARRLANICRSCQLRF
jgi:hypothetical protein